MSNIRVTIEKGYQPIVQKAMARLGTEDYKVGVQHILGEWSASQLTAQSQQVSDQQVVQNPTNNQ